MAKICTQARYAIEVSYAEESPKRGKRGTISCSDGGNTRENPMSRPTSSIREAIAPSPTKGVPIRTFVICIAALGLFGLTLSAMDAPTNAPVAPLSEAEQRAAKAHADNLCLMSEQSGKDAAQTIAGLADIHSVSDPSLHMDQEVRFVFARTEMASDRGCV